jgi:hypothetical protein
MVYKRYIATVFDSESNDLNHSPINKAAYGIYLTDADDPNYCLIGMEGHTY